MRLTCQVTEKDIYLLQVSTSKFFVFEKTQYIYICSNNISNSNIIY